MAKAKPSAHRLASFYADMVAAIRGITGRGAGNGYEIPRAVTTTMNALPSPPPGVLPKGAKTMAQDSALSASYDFVANADWSGYGFVGYPLLAELAQIPEFRRPSEILANEMTRKWVRVISVNEDADNGEKVKEIENELDRFRVQDLLRSAFEKDNFFGRSQIFVDCANCDLDSGEGLDKPLDLETNMGKGGLRGFKLIEPIWTYPAQYNSTNPLKQDFYKPSTWYVQGKQVHKTRLIDFISRPVPDIYKPSYLFGGVSLTQLLFPYVENWLRTRRSVSELLHAFSVMVLKTDMGQSLEPGAGQAMANRIDLFNTMRDNMGLFALNKETEEFENVSAPISGLDALQGQAIEQMAFPGGIPLVKLLGVTPSGLNASSDGEIRVFYDTIASLQERVGTPALRRIIEAIQVNKYGAVDETIDFQWLPLWEMTDKEAAEVEKLKVDTDQVLVELGAIGPEEVRARVVRAEDSAYSGLSVEEMPDPMETGEQVLSVQGREFDPSKHDDEPGEFNPSNGEADFRGNVEAGRGAP